MDTFVVFYARSLNNLKNEGQINGMGKIGLATIGVGGRGSQIVEAIASEFKSEIELKVVCDIDETIARNAKEKYGFARATTDCEEAISSGDVDAVAIAVPSGLHLENVLTAAQAGKHVLCEKPISVETRHADEMIAACDRAGVVFSIAYNYRFNENRNKIRNLLREGAIGRPVFWRETLPPYEQAQQWLSDPVLGGGALFEYSHSIDYACFTFGKPKWVFAQMMKFQQDPLWKTHDSYNVVIKFESGDFYQISGFGCIPMGYSASEPFRDSTRFRENDIVGPSGHVFTGMWNGERRMIVTKNLGTKRQEVAYSDWGQWGGGCLIDPLPAMIRDFIDCVRQSRQSNIIPASQARQTYALVNACMESSRKEEKIYL